MNGTRLAGTEDLSVPVDANAMFAISSATKSYAAALLINLQKDGILSLNDPVAKFLPAFRNTRRGPVRPQGSAGSSYCLAHIRIIYFQREI